MNRYDITYDDANLFVNGSDREKETVRNKYEPICNTPERLTFLEEHARSMLSRYRYNLVSLTKRAKYQEFLEEARGLIGNGRLMSGLCQVASDMDVRDIISDELQDEYPFNTSMLDFEKEVYHKRLHLNPLRKKWVEDQLNSTQPIQLIRPESKTIEVLWALDNLRERYDGLPYNVKSELRREGLGIDLDRGAPCPPDHQSIERIRSVYMEDILRLRLLKSKSAVLCRDLTGTSLPECERLGILGVGQVVLDIPTCGRGAFPFTWQVLKDLNAPILGKVNRDVLFYLRRMYDRDDSRDGYLITDWDNFRSYNDDLKQFELVSDFILGYEHRPNSVLAVPGYEEFIERFCPKVVLETDLHFDMVHLNQGQLYAALSILEDIGSRLAVFRLRESMDPETSTDNSYTGKMVRDFEKAVGSGIAVSKVAGMLLPRNYK